MKIEERKILGDNFNVSEKLHRSTKIAKLIGTKPIVRCEIDGVPVEGLWDTGSQVSVISREKLNELFPEAKIEPIENFIGEDKLSLQAANSTIMSFSGVAVLKFGINECCSFDVPFIVATEHTKDIIIGNNVIVHIVVNCEPKNIDEILKNAMPTILDCGKLIAELKGKAGNPDFLGDVKTAEKVVIPAMTRLRLECRAKVNLSENETNILFEPFPEGYFDKISFQESFGTLIRGKSQKIFVDVTNHSNSDYILPKGTLVGTAHSVSAVIPLPSISKKASVQNVDINHVSAEKESWQPKTDLHHLSDDERRKVEDLLREQCDVFSKTEFDLGKIDDFQMEIKMIDETPINEAYRQIPRHLYGEVKNYIDDAISSNLIRKSFSNYVSPMVCVRKSCGGLRLCIDYRTSYP